MRPDHELIAEKIGPGDYQVRVGDAEYFDSFHFRTERDAQRFVRASDYAFARKRAR